MRHSPVWTILPLILFAALREHGAERNAAAAWKTLHGACRRTQGECDAGSIYVFPELTNVR